MKLKYLLSKIKSTFGFKPKHTFKFSIHEIVKITLYSKDPKEWYAGIVIKTINDSDGNQYYVFFLNDKKQNVYHWFYEDELRKFDQVDERDKRIDMILS